MNKRLLSTLLATLILTSPLAANATGFYLGGSLGHGYQSNQDMKGTESTGVGMLKAGYDINDYIGFEVRYGGVNESSETSINHFTSAYAKVQYPISESFSVYGLAGSTLTSVNGDGLTVIDTGPIAIPSDLEIVHESVTTNDSSFSFGAGARYAITQGLGVNLELMRVASGKGYTMDAIMLGVDYKF